MATVKIVFVTRRFPPFAGGAEQQLSCVAATLAEKGHEVFVFTSAGGGRAVQDINGGLTARAPFVHRLCEPSIRFLGTAVFLGGLLFSFLRYARTADAIVVSQVNETAAFAALLARLLGVPVCCRLTNYGESYGNFAWAKDKWLGGLYCWAIRRADAIIVQHSGFIPDTLNNGCCRDRIHIIPNAVSERFCTAEKAAPRQNRPAQANNNWQLLWCGRLVPMKNPRMLIEIAEVLLEREYLHFLIDVVGDGEDRPGLKAAIEASKLGDRIRLHGFQPDVKPFLNQADLFLLTSDHDPMPNVVLEAMASGLPVVATRVGGVPKMVVDGSTGFLVPAGEAEVMASALSRLMEDTSLVRSMAQKGREHVQTNFSAASIAKRYEELFRRLRPGIQD